MKDLIYMFQISKHRIDIDDVFLIFVSGCTAWLIGFVAVFVINF